MKSKIQSGILAAFAADALALGVHWVYDISLIKNRYGRLDHIVKPELAPYHKTRQKGDFTHYGDQMFVLLESLDNCRGFDLDDFAVQWQTLFETYNGYLDHATRQTLENFKNKKPPQDAGSASADLGGASRMVPLALFYGDDMDQFIDCADRQTAMTHNDPLVRESARFFAAVAVAVIKGADPVAALETSAQTFSTESKIPEMVARGIKSVETKTAAAISGFGQMCETSAAFPSSIHLIAKYPNDLKTALIENIMAGGDSSARGILCAFILGLHNGIGAVPQQWLNEMIAVRQVKAMAGIE